MPVADTAALARAYQALVNFQPFPVGAALPSGGKSSGVPNVKVIATGAETSALEYTSISRIEVTGLSAAEMLLRSDLRERVRKAISQYVNGAEHTDGVVEIVNIAQRQSISTPTSRSATAATRLTSRELVGSPNASTHTLAPTSAPTTAPTAAPVPVPVVAFDARVTDRFESTGHHHSRMMEAYRWSAPSPSPISMALRQQLQLLTTPTALSSATVGADVPEMNAQFLLPPVLLAPVPAPAPERIYHILVTAAVAAAAADAAAGGATFYPFRHSGSTNGSYTGSTKHTTGSLAWKVFGPLFGCFFGLVLVGMAAYMLKVTHASNKVVHRGSGGGKKRQVSGAVPVKAGYFGGIRNGGGKSSGGSRGGGGATSDMREGASSKSRSSSSSSSSSGSRSESVV